MWVCEWLWDASKSLISMFSGRKIICGQMSCTLVYQAPKQQWVCWTRPVMQMLAWVPKPSAPSSLGGWLIASATYALHNTTWAHKLCWHQRIGWFLSRSKFSTTLYIRISLFPTVELIWVDFQCQLKASLSCMPYSRHSYQTAIIVVSKLSLLSKVPHGKSIHVKVSRPD